jgi:hypothetical protein
MRRRVRGERLPRHLHRPPTHGAARILVFRPPDRRKVFLAIPLSRPLHGIPTRVILRRP